jgi:hypothetical protein
VRLNPAGRRFVRPFRALVYVMSVAMNRQLSDRGKAGALPPVPRDHSKLVVIKTIYSLIHRSSQTATLSRGAGRQLGRCGRRALNAAASSKTNIRLSSSVSRRRPNYIPISSRGFT